MQKKNKPLEIKKSLKLNTFYIHYTVWNAVINII